MGFPTAEIHNHIRGLSPTLRAFSTLKDEAGRTFDVKILTSAVSDDAPGGLAPGETEVRGRRLFAGTSDGAIEILEAQPSGKEKDGRLVIPARISSGKIPYVALKMEYPASYRDTADCGCSQLMDVLAARGVKTIVLSPGSRNTPLMIACTQLVRS